MSVPRTDAAAVGPEFSELWRNVSKLCQNKTQDRKTGRQMPGTMTSPMFNDLLSPRHRGGGRYPGLNNGDSPGDAEVSQDIFWDSTSPTQAGSGHWNTRIVEISEIVNRIAPKNVKPKGKESSLLQWISDSAVPCTPESQKPRVRKRSSRQSSVEDLMKLARQFDENMQQDEETSNRQNTANKNLNKDGNASETSLSSHAKDVKCPSSSDQVEAELHALFDCSTQGVSGRLSDVSADSQEIKGRPATSASAEGRQSEFQTADRRDSAARPAEQKGTCIYSKNRCDDFYDDWENDDFLDDSFVLALTQNPNELLDANPKAAFTPDTKTNTTVCESTKNTDSARPPSDSHCKASCGALQERCPKPKTTNRSTFKLQPNPHFQLKMSKDVSKSSFTAARPKSNVTDQKSATTKTPQADKVTENQSGGYLKKPSVKDISDCLWDDWDDDALLYQVCDSVERSSNSQTPRNCQQKQDIAADRQKKTTEPLPIDTAWCIKAGASANRQPERAFVRSNSLPGTSCETVNYQGWNIPMKGANNKSGMSQSFPGSRKNLGAFTQSGNNNVDMKSHTVTARGPQNSKSHHTAFKRNVSDSELIRNKVFVTSQMTGQCSAAEIERKKQEALARRRQRMQNASKPS
ncbi:uncharacterized protein etaa1b [Odontesthes bonariensis]|uniref:uncharacterized protein etaa1b n=1 Tax=Odontesthes bonariensis TaxID=219752 RepID=UPI003F589AB6